MPYEAPYLSARGRNDPFDAALREDEIVPGLVALIDLNIRGHAECVAFTPAQMRRIVDELDRPHLCACYAVDGRFSEWAVLTSKEAAYRLAIPIHWKVGGPDSFRLVTSYLDHGANVFLARSDAIAMHSRANRTQRDNRGRISPRAVDAIAAIAAKCRGTRRTFVRACPVPEPPAAAPAVAEPGGIPPEPDRPNMLITPPTVFGRPRIVRTA